jgi:hypothetical protein
MIYKRVKKTHYLSWGSDNVVVVVVVVKENRWPRISEPIIDDSASLAKI